MSIAPFFAFTFAGLLCYVLASAGWQKLHNVDYYAQVIDEYQLAPAGAGGRVVIPLGALELLCGLGLVVPIFQQACAQAAASLLLLYLLALGVNLWRGRSHIDCGCHGPVQQQPLSAWLLVRNSTLIIIAMYLAFGELQRPPAWLDMLVCIPAILACVACYESLGLLIANHQRAVALGLRKD